MKNIIKLLVVLPFIVGFVCTSCEDPLPNKAVNEWEDKDVFRIPQMAEGVLNKAYSNINNRLDYFQNNFLDVATDNALTNDQSTEVYKVGQGLMTTFSNRIGNWTECYNNLQYINKFMEEGLTDVVKYSKSDSITDAAIKRRLLGEAYFLRAWWSFQLLQRHGGKTDGGEALGYPIVTKFITDEEARDPDLFVRNTYEECVNQIVADCDSAINRLPVKYTGNDVVTGIQHTGRATSIAAAVLKVNALLYGASPAYQPDNITQITGMGTFNVVDATAYKAKWERLALYADTLIRNADGKFGAFGAYYAVKSTDLADVAATTPADFVFRIMFRNNNMETQHFPPYFYGNARTVPSQNLVDAFPMKNGYPISHASSGYDPQNPYVNRDNRFDMNIYYQGRVFAQSQAPIDVVYGGKDSESFSPLASRTGYYLRKHISITDNMLEPTQKKQSAHYNPLLRKGEVHLAFAEASNEVWGPTTKGPNCAYSAYDVIKSIRQASGGITDTGYLDEMAANESDFRLLIQNERRLETTFENQRFFDMRRWVLPLNESIKGVVVERDEANVLSYSVREVEQRLMNDVKHYYIPLPYGEILRNKNIVNNLGWK